MEKNQAINDYIRSKIRLAATAAAPMMVKFAEEYIYKHEYQSTLEAEAASNKHSTFQTKQSMVIYNHHL